MSRNIGDFYCLNCLRLLRTENKLESHKKVFEKKNFCGVVMLSEDNKILEFNRYWKFDKTLSNIYADLESLIKRVDWYKNNFKNDSQLK